MTKRSTLLLLLFLLLLLAAIRGDKIKMAEALIVTFPQTITVEERDAD